MPNLLNQILSFLYKKIKSEKTLTKIFEVLPHDPDWTTQKFYLYMKRIKDSVATYVNEKVIIKFLEIQEAKCELYSYEEQLFYLKVCRMAIMKFLKDDAVLLCMTSSRMSEAKRKAHLMARQALLREFTRLCR